MPWREAAALVTVPVALPSSCPVAAWLKATPLVAVILARLPWQTALAPMRHRPLELRLGRKLALERPQEAVRPAWRPDTAELLPLVQFVAHNTDLLADVRPVPSERRLRPFVRLVFPLVAPVARPALTVPTRLPSQTVTQLWRLLVVGPAAVLARLPIRTVRQGAGRRRPRLRPLRHKRLLVLSVSLLSVPRRLATPPPAALVALEDYALLNYCDWSLLALGRSYLDGVYSQRLRCRDYLVLLLRTRFRQSLQDGLQLLC